MYSSIQIVIPTMEGRERYLKGAIQSCLEQTVKNIGVIVSNNGGSQAIRKCVELFDADRVTYVETESVLPMSAHWEFAIGFVTADYFCVLGDDDALMPSCAANIFKALEKFPNAQSVVHRPAQYYWPDYLVDDCRNRYLIHGGCTGEIRRRETKEILKQVCAFKAHYGRLPFLYHGFVSTELVRKIQREEGRIFARISPDIYSDLLLAVYLDTFVEIDAPLTLGGQGARSNGVNVLLNTNVGKLFYTDLPKYLVPRRPAFSIYLQLYEYLEDVRAKHMKSENIDIDWWAFVFRTMIEAIVSDSYCSEIILGTKDALKDGCANKMQRSVLSAGMGLIQFKFIRYGLRWLYDYRSSIALKKWSNAVTDYSAVTAIDVAVAIDRERLIGENA